MKQRGQSIVYAILLMPTLFLVIALAIDIATLQLERLRVNYALDLATVTAATAVDPAAYSHTGQLRLDPIAATTVAREYLVRNLREVPGMPDSKAIAAAADIAVINDVPSRDPYRGVLLDRPAICVRIRVPHRFAFLGWVGLASADITVAAEAEIRT